MPKGYDIRTKATVQEGIVLDQETGYFHYTRVVEYQPGNGTRYVLVITRVATPTSRAEVRDVFGTGDERDTFLVVKLNAGQGTAMLVGGVDHFLHFNSVQEKLGVGLSDAVVLAELIGTLLNMKHLTCEQFEALPDD
jgi:hypothetical protein